MLGIHMSSWLSYQQEKAQPYQDSVWTTLNAMQMGARVDTEMALGSERALVAYIGVCDTVPVPSSLIPSCACCCFR